MKRSQVSTASSYNTFPYKETYVCSHDDLSTQVQIKLFEFLKTTIIDVTM